MRRLTAGQLLGRKLTRAELRYAPAMLYADGPMVAPLGPCAAVVGTRRPTAAGVGDAAAVAKALAGMGLTIVSGLAAGIDAAAHHEAIGAGGRTVAVLGTPLDTHYPKSNAALQDKIAAEHLVLSQFPAGRPVSRGNFTERNRTIALIADAAIMVEAGETGGTIHVGWETIRLRRPLFACGAAARTRPEWLGRMMRHGATILQDPADIARMLPRGRAVQSML